MRVSAETCTQVEAGAPGTIRCRRFFLRSEILARPVRKPIRTPTLAKLLIALEWRGQRHPYFD